MASDGRPTLGHIVDFLQSFPRDDTLEATLARAEVFEDFSRLFGPVLLARCAQQAGPRAGDELSAEPKPVNNQAEDAQTPTRAGARLNNTDTASGSQTPDTPARTTPETDPDGPEKDPFDASFLQLDTWTTSPMVFWEQAIEPVRHIQVIEPSQRFQVFLEHAIRQRSQLDVRFTCISYKFSSVSVYLVFRQRFPIGSIKTAAVKAFLNDFNVSSTQVTDCQKLLTAGERRHNFCQSLGPGYSDLDTDYGPLFCPDVFSNLRWDEPHYRQKVLKHFPEKLSQGLVRWSGSSGARQAAKVIIEFSRRFIWALPTIITTPQTFHLGSRPRSSRRPLPVDQDVADPVSDEAMAMATDEVMVSDNTMVLDEVEPVTPSHLVIPPSEAMLPPMLPPSSAPQPHPVLPSPLALSAPQPLRMPPPMTLQPQMTLQPPLMLQPSFTLQQQRVPRLGEKQMCLPGFTELLRDAQVGGDWM